MATVTTLDEMTFAQFIADAPLAVVEFWAAWCGPCKMMSPVLDDIAEAYAGKIAVAKINVDDCAEIARKCRVTNIPSVVVLKAGEEAGRTVGYLNKDALVNKIDEMIK